MSSSIKSERNDIHFEHDLLKSHMKKDINSFSIRGRGKCIAIGKGKYITYTTEMFKNLK